MPKRTRAGVLLALTVTGLTLTVTGPAPGTTLATPAKHEAGRRRLGSRLTKNIKSCAASIEKADPETGAALKDYSTLLVEVSTQVHGLHTVISWGASDNRLFCVCSPSAGTAGPSRP